MLIRNYALISSAFAIAAASALLLSPSGFDDYDLAEGPDYAYRVAVDDEGYVYVATTCTSMDGFGRPCQLAEDLKALVGSFGA